MLNLAEIDTSNFAGKMMHRDDLMSSDISCVILSDPRVALETFKTGTSNLELDTMLPYDSLIAN